MSELPLPKRKPDFQRTPMTPEHLKNIRGPRAPRVLRKFTVADFEYKPDVTLFVCKTTGAFWVAGKIDSVCPPVMADGRTMAASAWLREHARNLINQK